ncbi:MAG: glycoside hydrolase family 55 protein, partial [Planctomycetaceae bacterium]|nr:glycoside hydrolase family 55 protein [Planctomycetaceae bacterium]
MMKCIVFFSTAVLVCCMNLFFATEAIAQLTGNGVADDAQAIQAMLDSGEKLVYLPPPAKHYVISKPLRIHSNQTLKLDPATVIRLADGSDNYMLVNADPDKGNKNIVISGGIWDGNNVGVNHAKGPRNGAHPHQFFIGSAFLLMNVENLRVEKLTVKDPEKFGIHIGACRK